MHESSPLSSLPATRRDRWTLLDALISHWHRPQDSAGYSEKSLRKAERSRKFPIPAALSEWYTQFGNHTAVWSQQDDLLKPDQLYVENEVLIFYVENQGVVRWGIPISDLDTADPSVVVESTESSDTWLTQSESVSAFAIFMFAYTLAFTDHNPYIYGFATPDLAERIRTSFPALEFPTNWWTGTRIYGYDNLIVAIDCTNHVHACATSVNALETFRSLTTDDTLQELASSDSD